MKKYLLTWKDHVWSNNLKMCTIRNIQYLERFSGLSCKLELNDYNIKGTFQRNSKISNEKFLKTHLWNSWRKIDFLLMKKSIKTFLSYKTIR